MESSVEINQSFFETLFKDLLYNRKSFKKKYCDLFYRNHCDLLLLLVNKSKVKKYSTTNEYLLIDTDTRIVVVGYDYENKLLFTNTFIEHVDVLNMCDAEVKYFLFQYHKDILTNNYTVSSEDTGYNLRVQGDLCIRILNTFNNYSELFNEYIRALMWSGSLRNSITRYVALKVQQHLLKHRIFAEINSSRIVIHRVLNYYTKAYPFKKDIVKEIITNILKELPDLIKEHIDYIYVGKTRGSNYSYVEISIRPNEYSQLYRIIQNIVEKELDNKFIELNISIGNHEIYIDKVLPLIVRASYDNNEFVLQESGLYVTPNTTMMIKHNEHGLKKIKFEKYTVFTINTLNSAHDQALLLNFITFKNMIDEYIKKNNIDLRKFFS